MGKREKILITLSVSAFLFLIISKFMGPDKKDPESQANGISQSLTDQFAKEQLEMLKKFGQYDSEKMIVKKAVVNWNNDPFAGPELMKQIEGVEEKEKSVAKTTQKEESPLLYSGYIHTGKKLLAIINGMEYEKGDTVADTHYKVFSASTESVMLRSPDAVITEVRLIDEQNSLQDIRNKKHEER